MTQIKTRVVTLKSIIHNRYFTLGFTEVLQGKPFSPEYDKWATNEQWQYERGRQFAILTKGEVPPKVGKKVSNWAIYAYADLMHSGALL